MSPQIPEMNLEEEDAQELCLEIENEIHDVIFRHGWPTVACPRFELDRSADGYNYKPGESGMIRHNELLSNVLGLPFALVHCDFSGISCLRMEDVENDRKKIVAEVLGKICHHIHQAFASKFLEYNNFTASN